MVRVLDRRLPVREDTALRVVAAAEQIGHHAAARLRQRVEETPKRTFGLLLQETGACVLPQLDETPPH